MKPTVHYIALLELPELERPTLLLPIDHPSQLVSNTKAILTSPVVAFDPQTGRLETENTVYVPVQITH